MDGLSAIYVSSSSFKVANDVAQSFSQNRRVRLDCGTDGIKYGTIESSSFDGSNTVVILYEDVVTSNLSYVWFGIVTSGNSGSLPLHKSSHSTGGSDEITPADIGAEPSFSKNSAFNKNFASEEVAIEGLSEDTIMSPSTTAAFLKHKEFDGVFGLKWNKATGNFTRLYEAEGLSGGSDFNGIGPWDLKRCNISDSAIVNAYHGDPTFDYTGGNGQVMAQMNPFWYRTYREAGSIVFLASEVPKPNFKIYPAFIRNGIQMDNIYVSAFEGYYNSVDEKMESIANVVPSTNDGVSGENKTPITAYPDATIIGCRGYAQARGDYWEQHDFLTHNALCYLMFIEYGTFDMQTAIGKGVVDKASGSNNNAEKTGQTAGFDGGTDLGNNSGQISTNGLKSVSYRGVENLWGNIWKFVDGLNIQGDHKPWITDHGFVSDNFQTPYYSLNTTLPNSNSFGSDIVLNEMIDFGFLPSEVNGASNSGLFDNYYQNTGNKIARAGGSWSHSLLAGPLFWSLSSDSANSYRNIGARLLCLSSKYNR